MFLSNGAVMHNAPTSPCRTRYLIYRDDRGPQPVYQTNMMTAEKVAALAGITLEQVRLLLGLMLLAHLNIAALFTTAKHVCCAATASMEGCQRSVLLRLVNDARRDFP